MIKKLVQILIKLSDLLIVPLYVVIVALLVLRDFIDADFLQVAWYSLMIPTAIICIGAVLLMFKNKKK